MPVEHYPAAMRNALCLLVLLPLAACAPQAKPLEPGQKLKVMAAAPHLASLAMAIAGESAGVEMLPPADKSSHDYQPTMEDRRRLESSHLLLINGLQLEGWDPAKVAQAAGVKLVDCGSKLGAKFLIDEEEAEHGHDHDHDHAHGANNPHVWMCAEGATLQARIIAKALSEADESNAAGYDSRLKELEGRLTALRDKYKPQVEKLARKSFVSNHDAFPYFAREYGLKQVGVIQRTPGTNPTMSERREIEEIIRKGGAHAIFLEPGYDDAASRQIAEATGLKLATLDPFDSGTPGPRALEDVLEKNLKTVLATLGD
jgi:ABC-type Zn uptake system ZnuABC Zn-binding protein ZnuA